MVDLGTAVAVMGNHELNALHYHAKGDNWLGVDDGYMRAHVAKNTRQHETFLEEYPIGSDAAQEVMDWFLTLPLFLDLDGIRLVHACWDAAHIDLVKRRRPNGRLVTGDLQEVALEQTEFAWAVVNLVKGPEAQLPEECGFHDYHDVRRTKVRIKWWAEPGGTWRNATLSVKDPTELPETSIEGLIDVTLYAQDAPPVFFGHYKRHGRPKEPDARNVMCLDYPKAPCAYRWNGERALSAENLVTIEPNQQMTAEDTV